MFRPSRPFRDYKQIAVYVLRTGPAIRKPHSRFHMVKNEPTRTVASCTSGVTLTAMIPKNVWMQKLRYRYKKNQKNCGTYRGERRGRR